MVYEKKTKKDSHKYNGDDVIVTVRLDEALELKLERMAKALRKKKSDVIREAIEFYANSVESEKKSRIRLVVEKTKEADKVLYESINSLHVKPKPRGKFPSR